MTVADTFLITYRRGLLPRFNNGNRWKGNCLMKSKLNGFAPVPVIVTLCVPAILCLSGYAYGSGREPDFGGVVLLGIVLFGIIVLSAWCVAINLFIGIGKSKGHPMENAGLLWFVGIFATPLAVGLYVAALPDRRIASAKEKPSKDAAVEELPAI